MQVRAGARGTLRIHVVHAKGKSLLPKGVVPDEAITGIRAINRIRNEFAHELERTALSRDDDERVEASMTGPMASIFANLCEGEPSPPLIGGRVRLGILAIYAVLRRADGASVRI